MEMDNNIILYNDDFRNVVAQKEIHKTLRGGGVGLILTDLPYGTTSCKWDEIIPFDELWYNIHLLTSPSTPVLLFGQEPFSSKLRLSNLKEYKYDWIWYKNKPSGFVNAKYKPMCNHEIISVFYQEKPIYNPIKEERDLKPKYEHLKQGFERHGNYGSNTQGVRDGSKKSYSALRNPTTVKKFDVVPNNKGSRVHPTQKPIDLLEYLIKTYTNEDDVVVDLTMGSGSTGVACMNTSRKFIGIELDKHYYNIACKRLKYIN